MHGEEMTEGFESLINHFGKHGWKFEVDEESRLIVTQVQATNASFRLFACVDATDDLFHCVSIFPVNAPEHLRDEVAELCVRCNWGMKLGCFDFDMSDGEIRFRCDTPYEQGKLSDSVIESVVGFNVVTVDRFFPSFMAVMYGNQSPEDASDEIQAVIAADAAISQSEMEEEEDNANGDEEEK